MKTKLRPRQYGPLRTLSRRLTPTRLTHWLGIRAISMAPEQIALREGLRAAVAVGIMMALALTLQMPLMAWSAFAAFWTCLVDPGGPLVARLRTLLTFGTMGTVIAAIMSMAAGYGPVLAAPLLAVIVLCCGLSRLRGATATQIGVLAAIVAVVAICYPMPPHGALVLAGLFALGAGWAVVVCTIAWPVDAYAPLRQACAEIFREEGRMTRRMVIPPRQGMAGISGARTSIGAYRREIRSRIERTRARIEILSPDAAGSQTRAVLLPTLEICDRIFVVLIAFEHAVLLAPPSPMTRRILRHLMVMLERAARVVGQPTPDTMALQRHIARIDMLCAHENSLYGRGARTCATALRDLLFTLSETPRQHPVIHDGGRTAHQARWRGWPMVLRHAMRLSVSVLVAYGITREFSLPYAYWAMMAVVVVMQPQGVITLPRTIERVVGSIAGGLLAAIMGVVLPMWLILVLIFPLAAATIALRAVNYTLLVLFMTQLFVLVTDLVSPGAGWDVGMARSVNNIIGSLVGLAGCLVLWPERRGPALATQVAEAFIANIRYAVMATGTHEAERDKIEQARRMAGTTSTRAEIQCQQTRLEGLHRSARLDRAEQILFALRQMAGMASVNWMERSLSPSSAEATTPARFAQVMRQMEWPEIVSPPHRTLPSLDEMAAMLHDMTPVGEDTRTS
ncbi:FUSC family protein [Novacetimonas hansenii]|uniref:FUSC family protein n=1 Tax=Novacetimonas hansenii TaxID=436 RepID=UPI00177F03DC|nr:FUSC family protein [Novacetimonas hansenii]MBL7238189.1 FUSC family protein [Novacetimonas hansenii]QOF94357.1 FUSC family protein [Novacetimonas hansenii]